MLERILKLSIPTLYWWLAMFYTLFDLWLNIVAELLRFGDREFYKVSKVGWAAGVANMLMGWVRERQTDQLHPRAACPAGVVERHNSGRVLAAVEPASAQVDAAACLLPAHPPRRAQVQRRRVQFVIGWI